MRTGTILGTILLLTAASSLLSPAAGGGDADAILDKLVEKGVLTAVEAQEVRNEIGGQAKQRDEEQRALIKEAGAEIVPKWTQAITIGGDLRLRHDSIRSWFDSAVLHEGAPVDTVKTDKPDRHRERIRMRLGMKAKLAPSLEAGFRLSTGSSLNPISTNQTLGQIFDRKPLFVDQAYLKVSTIGQPGTIPVTAWGGKFEIPFAYSQLVWDPDVTMEGAAASLTPTAGAVEFAFTGGAFPIREIAAKEADPALFGGQAAAGWSPAAHSARPSLKSLKIKASAAYYDFTHLRSGIDAAGGSGLGNTVKSSDKSANTLVLARDFDEFDVNAEIAATVSGRPGRLFGDYVRNTSPGGDDKGYLAGARWGRTDAPWAWEIGYYYEHLEADAVLAQFADSDLGDGGTNNQGHVAWITLGTLKNSTVGARFCTVENIKGLDRRTQLFQIDWVTKF